jgi:hypothetical protein
MSHFAKVENGMVTQVIVIEQDVLNTGYWGDPNSWVQTSYNTYGGVHRYTYDKERDAFYAPKPFVSWVLNEETCLWEPPVPMPTDGIEKGVFYNWNESHLTWDSNPIPTE